MPDMQTEVKKILQNWSTPEIKQESSSQVDTHDTHKSFNERVYDFIKANPRSTLKAIRTAFSMDNQDDSGLTNSLKTLYDRQLIGRVMITNPDFKGFGRRLVFVYWAVSDVYITPTRKPYSKRKGKVTKVVAKKKEAMPVERQTHTPKRTTMDIGRPTTTPEIQKIINNLTVYGAKELWKELNEVFGK